MIFYSREKTTLKMVSFGILEGNILLEREKNEED